MFEFMKKDVITLGWRCGWIGLFKKKGLISKNSSKKEIVPGDFLCAVFVITISLKNYIRRRQTQSTA